VSNPIQPIIIRGPKELLEQIQFIEFDAPDPEVAARPKIGIGITTRNRADVFPKTYAEIARLTPGAKIVVIDDASDIPVTGLSDVIRFEQNVGIARAKNACLEALYDAGCEHIFLFDDDAYPLVEDWWKPYVESPEPHLMRIFPDLAGTKKLNDIRKIYEGDGHVAYTGPRGMMLYVERRVLDVVGGMDVAYGKWGYEHGDWSNRIHNAGLTTWRFADVIGGENLIYSMDEHQTVNRGTTPPERAALVKENVKLYHANWDSAAFKSFRPPHDVILTCLFASKGDPQRPRTRPMDHAMLDPLLGTLEHREVFIFTDGDVGGQDEDGFNWVHADFGADNVYFQRWITYWRWLREHPEVRFVWMVDGTDVKLLREPFDLLPGKLYVGSEPVTLSTPWLKQNHPAKRVQELIAAYPDDLLYNAGLVGGDRETVMAFLHEMIRLWGTNQIDQFHKKDQALGVGDMGAFNLVLHSRGNPFEGRIVTGPAVHTTFKAEEEKHPTARWKHK
jgi:hypothetical protein